MRSKGSNCQQTLSTESGSWPSDTMIILKQAKSENDKVQQWWMLRLLLPGSAFIFIHRFWSGTPSAVRMALSRWSEQHSLRALSLFRDDWCITRRPGVGKIWIKSAAQTQKSSIMSAAHATSKIDSPIDSPNQSLCPFLFVDWEREKFIIRQPPIGGKDDYDSENSWISNGLPSSSRKRRGGGGGELLTSFFNLI